MIKEIIKNLGAAMDSLQTLDLDLKTKNLELEMKLYKVERGNETLQERIKEKDAIIADLKDVINTLKPRVQK